MINMTKQKSPMQCLQEQYQKGKIPLFTIIPSTVIVDIWVTIAGQTKCLSSVSGIIIPINEKRNGIIALLTFVLGMVYLLEGLWKLNLLRAMPQPKNVKLQRKQYLQKRLELFTNSGSQQSLSIISFIKQNAGTLTNIKRMEKARGVVLARVYFISIIFSFIIIDTSLALYFSVLKRDGKKWFIFLQ